MEQPIIHTFFAAKGGQGTTVTAVATALLHARAGRRTLLVDAAEHHDICAVIGVAEPYDPTKVATVAPNLDLVSIEPGTEPGDICGYDIVIIDAGQHRTNAGPATLVTRACYLALRRAIALTPAPDDAVLISECGRALHAADVAAVLNIPIIATIPAEPAIARLVDSGLLAARLPAGFSQLRREMTTPAKATT